MRASRRTIAASALSVFDAEFTALLHQIRAETLRREESRSLPFDEVRQLLGLGFGRLRLPAAQGGFGLTLKEYYRRVIDLAAADPNIAHAFRGHTGFVESLLAAPESRNRPERWLGRIAAGDLIGNANSERQSTNTLTTRVEDAAHGPVLSGTKYYTTGSIYADWIVLAALRADPDGTDRRVSIVVRNDGKRVRSVDDWDGFGQRLTGSGRTEFDRVPVDPDEITPVRSDDVLFTYLLSLWQLHLHAVTAGIAQAALDDVVAFVRPRRRTFGVSGESVPRHDELVQSVVGKVSAAADAARRLVLSHAAELDQALLVTDFATADPVSSPPEPLREALLSTYRLQQVVAPLVLDAVTELFEVGGASAVSTRYAFDRHWRNVRTLHSHNPALRRARAVGDFELNGVYPSWEIAAGAPAQPEENSPGSRKTHP